MKLLDWIPLDKIDWSNLSTNPNANHLLESVILDIDNPLVSIDWWQLSTNPNAIHFLDLDI